MSTALTAISLLSNCNFTYLAQVQQDLHAFLTKHPSVNVELVGLTEPNNVKYNTLQLRGKIEIVLQSRKRSVGYKILLL